MSNLIVTSVRNIFNEDSTGGDVLVNGEWFCYSQEDTARASGVKIPKLTCIPPGNYKVAVRRSASFKRDVLCLYTEDDKVTIKKGGVKFTYVYQHSGNTAAHSSGCIITAFNRMNKGHITGTAEHGLFNTVKAALDAGDNVVWQAVNDPDNVYRLKWEG